MQGLLPAQSAGAKKRLLAIGEEKGYRHEAVSHAMATIERLGMLTGLWDTQIRTDTEALTKKKLEIQELQKLNFKGLVAFEYEKEGPINDDVARQVAYARKLA